MTATAAESKRFDWKAVIGLMALASAGAFTIGAWGAGSAGGEAIGSGVLLWVGIAVVGGLYGYWSGWEGR